MIKLKSRGSLLYRNWFIWAVVLAVIQPDALVHMGAGVQLFNLISMGAFAVICVDLVCQRSFKPDWGILLILLLQLSLVFSSVLNDANVSYAVKKLLMIADIVLLTSKNLKNNAAGFIKSVYWLLYVCIAIHFVTLLVFPNGIFTSYYEYQGQQIPYLKHWFLSTGNNYVLFLVPTFFLDRIRLYRWNKKTDLLSLALYLMGFFGMVKSVASTSLIACLLFVCFAILIEWKKLPMPGLKTYVLLGVAFFVLLVFGDLGNLLGRLLGKEAGSVTFTGRTRTWEMAVYWIRQRPIFGYGYEREALLISKFGGNNTATHCHNLYLDLFYRTGIVGLSLFLVMLWRCARHLKRRKGAALSILLSFTLFLYLGVLFQMEAYFNLTLFYMLLTFGFRTEHWIDGVRPKEMST